MKAIFALLLLCGVLALSACRKPPESVDPYNPAVAPLTSDEVAALLDLQHWKITQTPGDGKPYWGVRLVVANRGFATVGDDPPYRMLYHTALTRFDTPVESGSDPRLLLGLQIGSERITGQVNATCSKYTDTLRFEIPKNVCLPGKSGGNRICSGTRWKDNRVDLVEFLDPDNQIVSVLCLEFLHAEPGP